MERELGQSRDGGTDGKSARVAIEVKRQENLRLNDWLKQARQAAENSGSSENPKGLVPVVAYRQNGEPWRCLVELTPLQLAVFMRYQQNLDESAATIAAAHQELD